MYDWFWADEAFLRRHPWAMALARFGAVCAFISVAALAAVVIPVVLSVLGYLVTMPLR